MRVRSTGNIYTTSANRPRMYVYAPYITAVDFSGAVSATDWDTIEGQSFTVDASGAVTLNIDVNVERLDIDVSGAATMDFSGSADTINLDGSGAITIRAGNLQIDGGSVNVSGAGSVVLSTLENVNVRTSGVASVRAAN